MRRQQSALLETRLRILFRQQEPLPDCHSQDGEAQEPLGSQNEDCAPDSELFLVALAVCKHRGGVNRQQDLEKGPQECTAEELGHVEEETHPKSRQHDVGDIFARSGCALGLVKFVGAHAVQGHESGQEDGLHAIVSYHVRDV